jgi:hypothetical protein
VVDRLRLLLNRPLPDTDRPRLFAIAVVVIVAAAALLALVHAPTPPSRRARTMIAAPPAPASGALPTPIPTPSPTPPAASEEGRQAPSSTGSRADVTGAKRAAQRFLAGYLPYTYGRPGRMAAATSSLKRRLDQRRPRVPEHDRRLRPRLVLLQSDAVSHRRAQLLALIGDGAWRYTLHLELAHTAAGWFVTDVGA